MPYNYGVKTSQEEKNQASLKKLTLTAQKIIGSNAWINQGGHNILQDILASVSLSPSPPTSTSKFSMPSQFHQSLPSTCSQPPKCPEDTQWRAQQSRKGSTHIFLSFYKLPMPSQVGGGGKDYSHQWAKSFPNLFTQCTVSVTAAAVRL